MTEKNIFEVMQGPPPRQKTLSEMMDEVAKKYPGNEMYDIYFYRRTGKHFIRPVWRCKIKFYVPDIIYTDTGPTPEAARAAAMETMK